jgi:PKHD-type hydroxylase
MAISPTFWEIWAGYTHLRDRITATSDPLSQWQLGALILATLESNALFVSAVLPNRLYPPMFSHYVEGMRFGNHVDGSIRMLGPTQKLRTDLSATLFLSPKDSYDGGELIIENDFGNQRVKLDAGDMIVYLVRLAAHYHGLLRLWADT